MNLWGSPESLRLLAKGLRKPYLGLRQRVRIALLQAASRGLIGDPDGVLAAIEDEITAVEASIDRDIQTALTVSELHLNGAADRLDAKGSAQAKAEARVDRALLCMSATALAESFDPRGYFVYCLWGADDDRPLYVGLSTNVLARLGQHMSNRERRYGVQRVSLIKCKSHAQMESTESRLIGEYQPIWNVIGVR